MLFDSVVRRRRHGRCHFAVHLGCAVLGTLALLWLTSIGCSKGPTSAGPGSGTGPQSPEKELFDEAIQGLNRLDEFDQGQVVQQIVDRLNRWLGSQTPLEDWSVDPLVQRQAARVVPEDSPLRPIIEGLVNDLGKMELSNYDGLALMEAALLYRVSVWAGRGESDIREAKELFDWTVRNIQPIAAPFWIDPLVFGRAVPLPGLTRGCLGLQPLRRLAWAWKDRIGGTLAIASLRTPWQILMSGRGDWIQRGWVFLLLARQQRLDAVWLAVPEKGPGGQMLALWAVAVLHEGELYLFDPKLGLPIPAPGGVRFVPGKGLDVQPATLTQAANDPAVLQQLDLGPGDDQKYWVGASDARRVVAMIEASPAYVEQRMALVEPNLVQKDKKDEEDERAVQKLVLSISPYEQAQTVAEHPNVLDAQLWPAPYRVLAQQMAMNPQGEFGLFWQANVIPFDLYGPDLWTARVRHLGGTFVGENGAIGPYQDAFVPDSDLEDVRRGYQRALKDALVAHDARYWLGTLQFARGEYEEAARYFDQCTLRAWPQTRQSAIRGVETALEILESELEKPPGLRTIDAASPALVDKLREDKGMLEAAGPSPWTHGAKYNWARALEALGQIDEAVRLFESDPASFQHYGNRVRARLLRQSQTEPSGGQPPAEETP